jgi:hypothetical protein
VFEIRSKTAASYQEHFDRRDALPGMVASIQTFGSALNFNPHV